MSKDKNCYFPSIKGFLFILFLSDIWKRPAEHAHKPIYYLYYEPKT